MVLAALTASALLVAACSGERPPPQRTPANRSNAMNRPVTKRTALPAAIQPLLPRHGVYAAGGGLVSSAWRVVLDLDAQTLYGGTATGSNAPSFGPMDKEATRPLTPPNAQHLMQLAYAAWSEPAPERPPSPTADYDEVFLVLEGDDAFYLQGFGPIRRPKAAAAIVELRAAAGL